MDLLTQPATELGPGRVLAPAEGRALAPCRQPAEAGQDLDAALQAKPAPPEAEVLAVRVPMRIEQKQFAEAMQAVDASHLDGPVKGLWKVRIRLAELARTPEGDERRRFVGSCSGRSGPSRGARRRNRGWRCWSWRGPASSRARGSRRTPGTRWPTPTRGPASWRRPPARRIGPRTWHRRAARPRRRPATGSAPGPTSSRPADSTGPTPRCRGWPTIRRPARSVPAPACSAPWLAAAPCDHSPGASAAAYAEALERQVRDFPADPTSDEARWLLGELTVGASDRDRARRLWAAIPTGSPRWLDGPARPSPPWTATSSTAS